MRVMRPATGAEITKRSRTRVSPSSSMVTCIGPSVAVTTSTTMVSGQNAAAVMAATIAIASSRRGLFRRRIIRGS